MDVRLRNLMLELVKNAVIVGSWGITDIHEKTNSIDFNVSALKYSGHIQIVFDDIAKDEYSIIISNHKTFKVPLSKVVCSIDDAIERTENYMSDLSDWLSNL